jgi:arylsulfatase A-like enzyme
VKPGSVNKDIVSNVDFAQTFLAAAGTPAPDTMQGRSLVPLLAGKTPDDWRKSFYYQYYEYPVPHHVRPHYGVVTDRYKLVRFAGADADYTELFDLHKDPREMQSVIDQPDYVPIKKELEAEMARLRTELKVPDEIPPEALGGARPAAGKGKSKQPTK